MVSDMFFNPVSVSKEEYQDVRANVKVSIGNETRGCKNVNVTIPYMGNAMRDDTFTSPQINQNIMEKILLKLDEIQKGQEQLPTQLLSVIAIKRTSDNGKMMESMNHDKCEERYSQLEDRISLLEDTVSLMKREIQLLKKE